LECTFADGERVADGAEQRRVVGITPAKSVEADAVLAEWHFTSHQAMVPRPGILPDFTEPTFGGQTGDLELLLPGRSCVRDLAHVL
jgi:hypothetical protein